MVHGPPGQALEAGNTKCRPEPKGQKETRDVLNVSWHKSGHVLHFGFKNSVLGPQHTLPWVAVLVRPILLLPFLVPFFCLVFTKKLFPLTLLLVCFALVLLLYTVFVAWCQYIRCTGTYVLFTVLVMKWGCGSGCCPPVGDPPSYHNICTSANCCCCTAHAYHTSQHVDQLSHVSPHASSHQAFWADQVWSSWQHSRHSTHCLHWCLCWHLVLTR